MKRKRGKEAGNKREDRGRARRKGDIRIRGKNTHNRSARQERSRGDKGEKQ